MKLAGLILVVVTLFLSLVAGPRLQITSTNFSSTPRPVRTLRDFVARYKQAHPEVDVQFLDMGSREACERLRAERNRPPADL